MSVIRLADLIAMRGLGVFFASVGGVLLIEFPSYYRAELAFEAHAISTTGTVIETKEKKEYSAGGGIVPTQVNTKYLSTVEFHTHQGQTVQFTTTSACSSRRDCEQKTVLVRYEPNRPAQARIDSGTPLNMRVGGYGVLCFIFFLVGIALLVIDPHSRSTHHNN